MKATSTQTPDPACADDVALRLLAHLHDATPWRDLRIAAPLAPVFGGNQSFVYALRLEGKGAPSGPLILRILRPFLDPASVAREAALQEVLRDEGYPVAQVHHASPDPSVLGGAFMMMERLPGGPMVGGGSQTRGTIGLRGALQGFRAFVFGPWPTMLADLQARLHGLAVDEIRAGLRERGVDPETLSFDRSLARLAARQAEDSNPLLARAFDWLRAELPLLARRPESLCHGDFFPNQIIADGARVGGVIDWTDACFGPAEIDVVEVRVGIETLPMPLGPFGPPILRARVGKFYDAYTARAELPDREVLEYVEVFRCARSLLGVSERRRAIGEGHDPADNPNPYDAPRAVRAFEERIRRVVDH